MLRQRRSRQRRRQRRGSSEERTDPAWARSWKEAAGLERGSAVGVQCQFSSTWCLRRGMIAADQPTKQRLG
jgi:hypothetical protein